MPKTKKYDHVGAIISYEQGELPQHDTLVLFAYLIKTGLAWQLQGHYGRAAANLIQHKLISEEGVILTEQE